MFKNIPFLAGIPEDLFEKIVARSERREVPAGQIIFNEGDAADAMYSISVGDVEVYKKIEGQQTKVNTLHAGDFFGEMALATKLPRNATIITKTAVKLVVLSRELFDEIFGVNPELSEKISQAIVERSQDNDLADIQAKREKY